MRDLESCSYPISAVTFLVTTCLTVFKNYTDETAHIRFKQVYCVFRFKA